MKFYLIVYLLYIFFEIINKIYCNRLKKYIIIFIIIFITLYSGLRNNDIDYQNYLEVFNGIKPMVSFGFGILTNMAKGLNMSYSQFLFIISVINSYLLYRFYKYNNDNLDISLLIYLGYYFIMKNMIQYRNLLAILFIYNFLIDIFFKKKLKYFMGIIGIFIHSSSVIILILPLFNILKRIINKNIKYLLVGILILSCILYKYDLIKIFLNCIIKMQIPNISSKLNAYMYVSKEYSKMEHRIGLRDFKYLVESISMIILIKKDDILYKKLIILGFFMGIFIKLSFSFTAILSDRISENFLILEPLILGLIYNNDWNKVEHRIYRGLISCIFIYNILQIVYKNNYLIDMFY